MARRHVDGGVQPSCDCTSFVPGVTTYVACSVRHGKKRTSFSEVIYQPGGRMVRTLHRNEERAHGREAARAGDMRFSDSAARDNRKAGFHVIIEASVLRVPGSMPCPY